MNTLKGLFLGCLSGYVTLMVVLTVEEVSKLEYEKTKSYKRAIIDGVFKSVPYGVLYCFLYPRQIVRENYRDKNLQYLNEKIIKEINYYRNKNQ